MISVILGTKAQLIKMAPVMKCMQDNGIPYRFIHTGQHKETMDEMYSDFGLKQPDLKLYKGADIVSIPQIIAWFIKLLLKTVGQKKRIFGSEKNGVILVHGDTLSTLLGALMGKFSGKKVAHIESGLRSYNYFQPFPEEITRVFVFKLSDILFCPGNRAIQNVSKYNRKEIIDTVGNTMSDTVQLSMTKIQGQNKINDSAEPFALVSLHRYENIFDKDRINLIVELIELISQKHNLIFILHPPTRKQLFKYGLFDRINDNSNITCLDRMKHSDFLKFLAQTEFVVTDGGSLQEESFYLGVPCLLFREVTERVEGLNENVVLSQFDSEIIDNFIDSYQEFRLNKSLDDSSPSVVVVEHLKKYTEFKDIIIVKAI